MPTFSLFALPIMLLVNGCAMRERGGRLLHPHRRSGGLFEGITAKATSEEQENRTGLSPKSPLLLSLYSLPVDAPFHSIIGNRGLDNIPLRESSDGVVPYSSSHLAGAVSERIVPTQHVTACQNLETVEELKRILRLHLSAKNT